MGNYNLYEAFDFTSKKHRDLVLMGDKTYTYADIDELVARVAGYFSTLKLQPGDRVVQQADKTVEAWCVYLACLRYGLVYVPLNPAFKDAEIAYYVKDTSPSLMVCQPNRMNLFQGLAVDVANKCEVETLAEHGQGSLMAKVMLQQPWRSVRKVSQETVAAILYTSGTTGKPKGAMLSHHNLFINAQDLIECWRFSPTDRLLHALPIYHCHGLFFASHCVLLSGASMHYLPRFDVGCVLSCLPDCTVMMGVPTYYTRLLASGQLNAELFPKMRLFVSGSAPLSEVVFSDFQSLTGHAILERYGMTETGVIASQGLISRHVGSVGKSLEHGDVRVVFEHDLLAVDGMPGEIQTKGEHVCLGYWCQAEKTQQAFTDDGYFRTGDIGVIDPQSGELSIIGRAKDMIITGGLNVYPKEVEYLIEMIAGVKECAVVGLPHRDLGEAVTAFVVRTKRDPSADRIIGAVKLAMANYKAPKKVVFIDALPRNSMGKVQKSLLRESYSALY